MIVRRSVILMKRKNALILAFVMLLIALSGCRERHNSDVGVSYEFSSPIDIEIKCSDGCVHTCIGFESVLLMDLLNTAEWIADDTAELSNDYVLTFGSKKVYYCSETGIFSDKENNMYFVADADNRNKINNELETAMQKSHIHNIQEPDWTEEVVMSAGDILAKKILSDDEKKVIREIFDADVVWRPEIPECAWTCIFVSYSLSINYCDCGTLSDIKNNRSRRLTEEEQEKIETLILNYSEDTEPVFVYDKYMITADGRNYLSEREYELYKKMVDSILDHDGVVEGFESYDEFFKVWGFMLSEFVPARKMVKTYLNAEEPFTYNDGTATLLFVADKETCDNNYAVFENIMNEALSQIRESDTDWERLAKIYLYVSQGMTYGSPYETYGVYGDFYDCIIYKMGKCAEYAYFLNMLANQIGFETIDGRSLGKDGFTGADHAWSMIYVDGEWYHFDACWQASSFSMETMQYFALSTEDRYTSLANNSFFGEPGDLEMFNQDDYTHEKGELPYCETGMSEEDRVSLYSTVVK